MIAAAHVAKSPPAASAQYRRVVIDASFLDDARAIEARLAGLPPTTPPASVTREATEVLRAKLRDARTRESDADYKVTIHDRWHRAVFLALCRRYDLPVHRNARDHRQTMRLRMPPSFDKQVLWREYVALTDGLEIHVRRLVEPVLRDLLLGDLRAVSDAMVDGLVGAERTR